MKLNTRNVTKKAGMTLLELTVVILVLLSLMTILFIGARQWKKGSDRAGCIMNLRNIQQAVRGHQNMTGHNAGDTPTNPAISKATFIGSGGYIETEPTCPGDGSAYTIAAPTSYPALGSLYAACGNATASIKAEHVPNDTTSW